MCKCLDKYGPLLGRFLLTVIFILAGIGKITDFAGNANLLVAKGLPMANVLLALAIIVELGGALMILVGWQARWAATALFFFVIVVTLIFHPFWSFQGAEAVQNFRDFFKNLAILGGLMYIMVHGSGPLSLGKDCCPGKCTAGN
jgi:putative oxidoreductase